MPTTREIDDEFTLYVTIKNGNGATIKGHGDALHAVELALTDAGFWYNEDVCTWDNGFYTSSLPMPRDRGE